MESQGTIKNGKPDGEDEMWWENGNKKVYTKFKNGEPNGFYFEWYENGQTKIQGFYVDGVIQDVEGFHPDGTPLKEGEKIEPTDWT